MTDREPDDLYDALRDRLADYGQEPPAQLWAGIRGQLPPPVAQPQLRRRKRRAALLALLLLIVGVGSWQWWRLGQKTSAPGTEATVATTSPAATAPTEKHSSGLPSTATISGNAQSAPASTTTVTAASSSTAARPAWAPPAGTVAGSRPGTADASMGSRTAASSASVAKASQAASSSALGGTVGTKKGRVTTGLPAVGLEGSTSHSTSRPLAAVVGNEHSGQARHRATLLGHPAGADATEASGAQLTRLAPAKTFNSRAAALALLAKSAARKGRNSRSLGNEAPARSAAQTARLIATARPARSTKPLAKPGGIAPVSVPASTLAPRHEAARAAQASEAAAATAAASGAAPAGLSFAGWNQLLPCSIVPDQAIWALPTVQALADTAPHLPAVALRRWALQLLAGPAVTYRQLGASLIGRAPNSLNSNAAFYDRAGAATSIPAQEQAAIGYGVQVQVRRALTGRWAVGTGLGYQVYATNLNLKTIPVPASAIPQVASFAASFRDSGQVRTVRLRDTYRFLTVPVRFSYQLGAGGRHFRAGLLAGADVAWYLGGASTEGSSCGCENQAWSITGSPYRPLNVALNLGLDLRYRFASRWEVLAQPSGTYFLTSLARPSSGFVPRYLLGGGMQLGFSYGLR